MIRIRQITAADWREWRALRLSALGEAPYAFRSKLTDSQGDGDVEQRWRDRLTAVPFNLIADLDGTPAGMASGTRDGDDAELISMWVAPPARGRGVADALIEAVLSWAATVHAARVVLCVLYGNDHAAAVYRRHGFVETGCDSPQRSGEPAERRMIRR